MSLIPNLESIEKKVLIRCISDPMFFREFYDKYGKYKFETNVRNWLYEALSECNGEDVGSAIVKRKNRDGYKKLLRVYKTFRAAKVSAVNEKLFNEFDDAVRINHNLKNIKKYLALVNSGKYDDANKILEMGFKTLDENLLDELEVSEDLDKTIENIRDSLTRDRIGKFGFSVLDKSTGGLWKGDLILLFGRPGVGKSIFLLNIAHKNRINGRNFAIINLEMNSDKVKRRYLSTVSRLDYKKYFKFGMIDKKEKIAIKKSVIRTGARGGKLFIITVKGECTLGTISSIVRKYKIKHNVQLFGVDFIDCVSSGTKAWSEQHELGQVTKGIKSIAADNNVSIVGLTHMNLSREEAEEEGILKQRDVGYSQRKNQFCDISIGMLVSNRDKEEGLTTFQGVKVRDAESDLFFKLKPRLNCMRFDEIKN